MKTRQVLKIFAPVLAGLLALLAQAAWSHHSAAMFDHDKVLELNGTVREFQFTNPHSWIQLEVAAAQGAPVEWSLEWGSPNQLARQGIRPSTFAPGTRVSLRINPMLDGTPAGLFVGARFEDGRTLGRWE
ncbi:MAG: DUF6152 family protein [Pseudomonadales bacterium]|nr:DUF6152 family protein [Pseudomonadales bacterium]